MKKTLINIVFIILCIVLGKFSFKALDYFTGEESKQIPNGVVKTPNMVIAEFEEAAIKINNMSPKIIEEGIRLDGASIGPDLRLTTRHTLLNYSVDEVDTKKFLNLYKTGKQKVFCEVFHKDKPVFHHGLFTYEFYGNDEQLITRFDLKMSDCL